MTITVKLDDGADLPFIKKMFSQIKGVKAVEIDEEENLIKKAIQKSRSQISKGDSVEYSKELVSNIFRKI